MNDANTDVLRQTGRTTRLIDSYIQKIFDGEVCIIRDHCFFDMKANENLYKRIAYRLRNEHCGHHKLDELFDFDDKNLMITRK